MSIAHLYPPTIASDALRRFTIDEYYRMAEIGVLGPDERVELLDGLVYHKGTDDLLPRRFTIDEYEKLAEAGILGPDERLELIDGVVYTMGPIGSRHAWCVQQITDSLYAHFPGRAIIRVQSPIRLPDFTEPEPDIALLRLRKDGYRSRHPGPADILLIVEVMGTSALRDRGQKLTAYAKAGIPEVWLVDLADETVEVHIEPTGPVYCRSAFRQRGESLAPASFPETPIALDVLFGPEDDDASKEAPAP